jgi:hypothetical protein
MFGTRLTRLAARTAFERGCKNRVTGWSRANALGLDCRTIASDALELPAMQQLPDVTNG